MNAYPWKTGASKLKIHQRLANSFCKGPTSWYFHLCRCVVSLLATYLCHCRGKAATEDKPHNYVSIQLYLQKHAMSQPWVVNSLKELRWGGNTVERRMCFLRPTPQDSIWVAFERGTTRILVSLELARRRGRKNKAKTLEVNRLGLQCHLLRLTDKVPCPWFPGLLNLRQQARASVSSDNWWGWWGWGR